MMPSIGHYRALVAVMEAGSVTAGALSLGRTQPQVSRLLAGLEQELGFELFARHRQRLLPTARGVRLYEEAKRALAGLDNLEVVSRSISRDGADVLRVFAPTYVAHSFLPEALGRLAKRMPALRISVEIVGRNSIGSWVSFHPFDIGIATLPFDRPSISVERFAAIETVVVVPLGHRLAGKRRILVGDLNGERFVTLGRNTPMRQRLDAVFAAAGVEPTIVAETSSSNSACELVAQGLGFTIVDSIVALPRQRQLKLALKRWQPGLTSEFGFIYPAATGPTKAAAEFMRVVSDVVLAADHRLVRRSA
jgi:DNA-binding transcriptional LysR family regulator